MTSLGVDRKLSLSYAIRERFGRSTVEITVSNGDERVIVHHAEVNPEYAHGKEAAAWGIVVSALARLFAEDE